MLSYGGSQHGDTVRAGQKGRKTHLGDFFDFGAIVDKVDDRTGQARDGEPLSGQQKPGKEEKV